MDKFLPHVNWHTNKITRLFKEPVTRVFNWTEYSFAGGDLFVVYELNGVYIYTRSGCGSCSGCDDLISAGESGDYPLLRELLTRDLQRFTVARSLEEINGWFTDYNMYDDLDFVSATYMHPELLKKWNDFYKGV